jgi:hypothetical protein
MVLSLGAKGRVAYQRYSVAADGPAALRVGEGALVVEFPTEHQGVTAAIQAPGQWVEEKGGVGSAAGGVQEGTVEIRADKGVRTIRLVKPPRQ